SSYFDGELATTLAKAIGWYLDYAFLQGSGGAQPLGVLNDPALIVVNKESGQAANTITYENVKNMLNRLHPACQKNAVWGANVGARAQLLGLVQTVKNVAGTENVGGSGIPILRETADGDFTLMGLEVEFTEKTPALSSQGDLLLADFSQYYVGLRREMSIDR